MKQKRGIRSKPGKKPGKTLGTYQDWINRGIHKPGKSADGLADVLGIGRTAVYKLISGVNIIYPEMLAPASRYFEEPIPHPDAIPIEREIGAGIGFERGTEVEREFGSIVTHKDFEFPNAIHHAYRFKGRSMVNAGVLDGDIIIGIETGDELKNGQVVVVERDLAGFIEVSLRVVFIFDDRVEYRVSSNNETYKPIVVPNKGKSLETVKVLSVVRRQTRDFQR